MGNPRQWDLGGMDLIVNSLTTNGSGPGRVAPASSTGSINVKYVSAAVAGAAPVLAELNGAFGTPATVGNGFIGILFDTGGTASFVCFVSNGNWYAISGGTAITS